MKVHDRSNVQKNVGRLHIGMDCHAIAMLLIPRRAKVRDLELCGHHTDHTLV